MKLAFTKMHGCGNDYIYINCFEQPVSNPEKLALKLSRRRFSVGSDGIILISPSDKADCRMRIFNADGSEAQMCGNGIRCVAKYLFDNYIARSREISIDTNCGVKNISITAVENDVTFVKVNMGRFETEPSKIPALFDGDSVIDRPIDACGHTWRVTCVSVGNPHAVIFCDDVDSLDLPAIGPAFENHPLFPERINTEFVQMIDKTHVKMRVWERGSAETFACGTGASASVAACVLNGKCDFDTDVKISLIGGDLTIKCDKDRTVWMTGPAEKSYDGFVEI